MSEKELIKHLLTFRNTLKMYHWRAKKYSKHKVSDELGEKMADLTDKFVEVLIASRKRRPDFPLDLKIREIKEDEIEEYLESFRDWVSEKIPTLLEDYETDLDNIKDEILAEINQGLYLIRME